jgi:hypothetical protein
MFCFEMRINYIDECLRLSETAFTKKFPDLWKKASGELKVVLAEYQKIAPKTPTKVMAHYWNPTNFNNPQDLTVPIELADPATYPHAYDSMDKLHFAVQGAYPHELNVPKRWYKDGEGFDHKWFASQYWKGLGNPSYTQ